MGHQVTYKSEKVTRKAVYYEGTDLLQEGYCLCYNADYGTASGVDTERAVRVEKPSATNLNNFAGTVTAESAGKTGPGYITINVPTARGQKVKVWTDQNCVIDTNLLSLVADSYIAQELGDGVNIIAKAMQTVDRSTTAGTVLALLSLQTNERLARIKLGAWDNLTTTAESGKNFWELWTRSTATTSTSRAIFVEHHVAGGSKGKGGYFEVIGDTAGLNEATGVQGRIGMEGTGTVTGLGTGLRGTVYVPDGEIGTGTVAGVMSEFYCVGDASAVAGSAKSFVRCCLDGDATGRTTLSGQLVLMDITGTTIGAAGDGNVVDAAAGDVAVTHFAHILIDDVDYYIMLRNAVT